MISFTRKKFILLIRNSLIPGNQDGARSHFILVRGPLAWLRVGQGYQQIKCFRCIINPFIQLISVSQLVKIILTWIIFYYVNIIGISNTIKPKLLVKVFSNLCVVISHSFLDHLLFILQKSSLSSTLTIMPYCFQHYSLLSLKVL